MSRAKVAFIAWSAVLVIAIALFLLRHVMAAEFCAGVACGVALRGIIESHNGKSRG